MGHQSKTDPPRYRDEADDEEHLLEPTSSTAGQDINQLAVPPPYSDEVDSTQEYRIANNGYVLPTLDAAQKLSDGTHVLIGGFEAEEPGWLENDIRRWASVPPVKMVDIHGTHTETRQKDKKSEQITVTDFHVKLRLTEYLFTHPGRSSIMKLKTVENHDRVYRGTVFKKDAGKNTAAADDIERTKPSLKEWCHRFHANSSKLKTFSITREVSGLNERQLQDKLCSLVRSTNYKGSVSVTFPIENPGVQVWSQHWINRWRHNMAICLLFYISMLWIFTWPVLFFTTKKYAVVKAVWAYSVPDEQGRPQYATMSEAQWFMRWQKTMERAIIGKVQGVLTEEDLARADAAPVVTPTGFSSIDAAASYLGAGIQAYQEANRQLGWGHDT